MTGLLLSLMPHLESFALVFLRVSVLVLFFPLWDSRLIPGQIKIFSILVLALMLTPVVKAYLPVFPGNLWEGAFLLLKEFLLGLSVFLGIRFLFAGVQMAGELVGIQMGFGMVTIIDPQADGQASLLSGVLYWLAVLLFLIVDGHHYLLRLLTESFKLVPPGWTLPDLSALPGALVPQGRQIFSLGIKLLAPVLVVIFLIQVALGLVARTVSQLQVMLISFPVTILLGLFCLGLTLPLVIPLLDARFTDLAPELGRILRLLQG